MHAPFEQLIADLASKIGHLSPDDLETHPNGDPARWNIRQIVEHLILTYRRSGANFDDRLAKGRPSKYRATLRQSLAKLALLGFAYFPPGVEAPAAVTPAAKPEHPIGGAALANLFAQELQTVDATLDRCQREFGRKPFAAHQVLGLLNAEQWRRFHVVHARHHLKQIQTLANTLVADAVLGGSRGLQPPKDNPK
jgi:hypothetical protein